MQVFLTNPDFKISAMELDDIRLNKQITEINQILLSYVNKGKSVGHENHPVNKWYNSIDGYRFLLDYLMDLCDEYKYRTGKIHMGEFTRQGLWLWFNDNSEMYLTEFIDSNWKPAYIKGSGKNQIITTENIYQLYQNLLIDKWNNDSPMPKWTNRKPPKWYIDYLSQSKNIVYNLSALAYKNSLDINDLCNLAYKKSLVCEIPVENILNEIIEKYKENPNHQARWKGQGFGDYRCSNCWNVVNERTKICNECFAIMDDWEED